MVHRIRGLIVDDVPENLKSVSTRLNQYLREQGWAVDWTMLDDPDAAHAAISGATAGGGFHLLVIDLLFERTTGGDEARGLELVALARAALPHSYVFVISEGDRHRHSLFARAMELGANTAVRRWEFSVESPLTSPAAIATDIRTYLLYNGTVEEIGVVVDESDPAVVTLLHEVGNPTIAQLHRQVLEADNETADVVRVRHLAPGVSGARICATEAPLRHGTTAHHVLKLSRDLDGLREETARAARAPKVMSSRFVVQPHRAVGPVNGWWATGSVCERGVTTARQWLGTGPAPERAEDAFATLFTEALSPMYWATARDESGDPMDALRLPLRRRQLVLRAVDELCPVLTRPDGGGLGDTTRLRADLTAYAVEGRLAGVYVPRWPDKRWSTHAHGDLHCGNILLLPGRHPAPMLIDFSDFGPAHWATDAARLVADLVVRVVDEGPESLFFTGFATWRALAAAVGDLSTDLVAVTDSPATNATLAALRWITGHLREICPPLTSEVDFAAHRWQWHIAFCLYLLRSTYHYEVPGPKRALALVAAHDQLRAGAEALTGHGR
ncbi:phosphotransferase [Actinokineospora auranticolor]|uniref:CheY-like chemotaxis protein n=1 Tax=Actinokineospora auranticolor TaxID=155976 RepID=A0A2S6GIZ7_9PSEU|nr:phosphotransferase [Actinokineospora auranticolor]PPK65204.1 CheY-like chemotaxis protein [Actinokineospora auranticolor]